MTLGCSYFNFWLQTSYEKDNARKKLTLLLLDYAQKEEQEHTYKKEQIAKNERNAAHAK
jgi:hypothetical protein